MAKRLTLSEQIAQLQDAAPADIDPEDLTGDRQLGGFDGNDSADESNPNNAARAHYVDVGPSALRKLHDSVADSKYEGVKSSRKALFDEEEQTGTEPEDSEAGSDEQSGSGDSSEEESSIKEEQVAPSSHPVEAADDPLVSTLARTREAERKKGKAVVEQLAIWNNLLDARIRMQKTMTAANLLPVPDKIPSFLGDDDSRAAAQRLLEESIKLSEDLFELREHLLSQADEINLPPRKKRKLETADEEYIAYEALITESSQEAASLKHACHPYVLGTLHKWSSKIQAVAPGTLRPSNRNAFRARRNDSLRGAADLIVESLADRDKVLGRTRLPRGLKTARIGAGERIGDADATDLDGNLKEDLEIFDDTDFYQQLLRDVIESRGGENGSSAADWLKTKQKKVKKVVDTKASKGRKVRYDVHDKIQHFMVPIPPSGKAWHEEQIDELFASLLGKGFEGAGEGYDVPGGMEILPEPGNVGEDLAKDSAMLGGLRVFG